MRAFFLAFLFLNIFISAHCGGDEFAKTKITKTKSGLLLGYQQGKFFTVELGLERQWKQMKIKKPLTIAGAFTMEYQFDANVIGYRVGPWMKFGRMDLTYGANAILFSDFERYRIGVDPAIGFKLVGFHIITGYNIMFGSEAFDYNTIHLSIRYYFSQKRKLHVKRDEKKYRGKDE